MSTKILVGDCRDILKTLPDESVHCCVTSPPYWGLRDYGVSGQIGLEPTIEQFVAEMVAVFREVRRVLRPDGTLWLNLGDSYATGTSSNRKPTQTGEHGYWENPDIAQRINGASSGLKPKDLCGIPWRIAFALQADGWYLRQDIIWAKPNPMPESVTDRCTKAHEYIFLLTKSARYFFDAEAIREEAEYGRREWSDADAVLAAATKAGDKRSNHGVRAKSSVTGGDPSAGRNKRSVWTVATAPFAEAHFATFPSALIEPCIRAGTSERGCCGKCGAPWMRQTERKFVSDGKSAKRGVERDVHDNRAAFGGDHGTWDVKTLGWQPTCKCDAPTVPCTVLDPFGGAGTTALVADRQQRNAIIIELNPAYAAMADKRVYDDAPLFQAAE